MDKLKIGILGLGLGRIFARAFLADGRVERLVVCDADAGRLAETQAAMPGAAHGYLSLEQMLNSEKLDAVAVITPDNFHKQHALQCLAAGCHVLLTKPLACNLDEGRAIVHAVDAAGKTLMVAHEKRFRPSTRALKALLASGRLGEIIHVRDDFISDKRDHFRRSPWYASPEAGRTALVGSGIHEVDRLRYLVGRPIVAVAGASNRLGGLAFPLAKTTSATFEFEGGAIGQVTVTYEAHAPRGKEIDDGFRMVCTKGLVVGSKYCWDGEADWHDLPPEPDPLGDGIRGCVAAFLGILLEGAANPVPAREAFASLAAAVAADDSAAGRAKTVPAAANG